MLVAIAFAQEIEIPDEIDDDELDEDEEILRLLEDKRIVRIELRVFFFKLTKFYSIIFSWKIWNERTSERVTLHQSIMLNMD